MSYCSKVRVHDPFRVTPILFWVGIWAELVGFVLSANTQRNTRNLSIESTQILGRGAYEAYSQRNLQFHCTSIIVKTITEPAVAHAHTFRFLY